MKDDVKKLINSWYDIDWFGRCGTCEDSSVVVVSSPQDAERFYTDLTWENQKNSIFNRYCELLWASYGPTDERRGKREDNRIHKAIRRFLSERGEGIFQNLTDFRDPRLAQFSLELDLRGILAEVCSQELVKPMFYYPVLYPWYKRGYMPCGRVGKEAIPEDWSGTSIEDLPPGRLRVF